MRTYKEIECPAYIERCTDKVFCDICSKDMEHNKCGQSKGGTLSLDVGYGSRFDFFFSEYSSSYDICDDCIEKLLIQLKAIVQ